MRRGVGVGKNLPYDPKYGEPYVRTTQKIFCGNSTSECPAGSVRGSSYRCLRKGVGVGKRIKASGGGYHNESHSNYRPGRRGFSFVDSNYNNMHLISFCFILNILLGLILSKLYKDYFQILLKDKYIYNKRRVLSFQILLVVLEIFAMYIFDVTM
jgi:hypothetical protein